MSTSTCSNRPHAHANLLAIEDDDDAGPVDSDAWGAMGCRPRELERGSTPRFRTTGSGLPVPGQHPGGGLPREVSRGSSISGQRTLPTDDAHGGRPIGRRWTSEEPWRRQECGGASSVEPSALPDQERAWGPAPTSRRWTLVPRAPRRGRDMRCRFGQGRERHDIRVHRRRSGDRGVVCIVIHGVPGSSWDGVAWARPEYAEHGTDGTVSAA